MDFYKVVPDIGDGQTINPYAAKINGEWVEGTISIDFLNENFGQYNTAAEMIAATASEGLKMYFGWLKDQGILN